MIFRVLLAWRPNFPSYRRHSNLLPISSGLLDSLPSDAKPCEALHIDSGPTSNRLPQEQRLVTVTAYIYASSKESDNDFHCIIGNSSSTSPSLMNAEVSGLPVATSVFFAPLTDARSEFKAFFTGNSSDALPASGYDKYNPPIPIKVTGSLFFDVDHLAAGSIGPTRLETENRLGEFTPSAPSNSNHDTPRHVKASSPRINHDKYRTFHIRHE